MADQKVPPAPQQIQIQDSMPGGEYTNLMNVGYSKEEFLLTFANIFPPSGKVVAKILTNPGHLKRMIKALEDSIKKYEAQFNVKIEEAEAPKQEIGFADRG